jgi:hypothetical protein
MEAHGVAVFGFLAILGVPAIGLLALIVGLVALARISRSGGALKGRGLALGAVVLGGLLMLLSLLAIPLLLFLGVNRPDAEVRSSTVRTAPGAPGPTEAPFIRPPSLPPPPPPVAPEPGPPVPAKPGEVRE